MNIEKLKNARKLLRRHQKKRKEKNRKEKIWEILTRSGHAEDEADISLGKVVHFLKGSVLWVNYDLHSKW